jgi:hypothetical protein
VYLFGYRRGAEDGSRAVVGVSEGGHPPHGDEHAALVVHQELVRKLKSGGQEGGKSGIGKSGIRIIRIIRWSY